MEQDKIICPHCKNPNEPIDSEDFNIEFTSMKCEHCKEEFKMSRKVEIEYDTWI